jgi:transposase-like protein
VAKSRQEWERIVAEYGRSGVRQGKFCKRRGVALSTLQYWLRKLRIEREAGKVELLPVRVTSRAERTSGVMEARVDRVALRFEVGTDPKYVAAVLHALADQC